MPRTVRSPPGTRVGLLALPGVTGIGFFGIHDVLRDGGLQPVVLAPEDGMIRSSSGLAIEPHSTLERAPAGLDVLVVPNVDVSPDRPLGEAYAGTAAWLRARFDAGAMVCSVCSGSLLLAEAGLLDGREATTHWLFVDTFRRFYPRVNLTPERILVVTGPHGRVLTAGGAASWQDLALFLLARARGGGEAVRTARLHLLDWHQSQSPYASMVDRVQHADGAIRRAQRWLSRHFATRNAVEGAMREAGLPERTFKRRFKHATGYTAIAYVHALRIEHAKELLERTSAPIGEVAQEVGYADVTFFRRLFRREVGDTPVAHRRRFGPIHAGLRDLARGRP